ncbi:MAG: HD domain-containing phosphohydrolase [Patescibacteria group bacterium]
MIRLADVREMGETGKFVFEVVEQHHERPDGKGVPRALNRDEISNTACLFMAVDAFVTMMWGQHPNSPHAKRDPKKRIAFVIKELRNGVRDGMFDGKAVALLVRVFRNGAFDDMKIMFNGSECTIGEMKVPQAHLDMERSGFDAGLQSQPVAAAKRG